MATHKSLKKKGKVGVEVVAGLVGIGTMVAMAPASFADTVNSQNMAENGYTSEKSLSPQELSALYQQLKTTETEISQDKLSNDLTGTLNQGKLENVTAVLQAITSCLQKAPELSSYASQLSELSSQLVSIAGEQKESLPQAKLEGMRTALQAITSQLEGIVSQVLASSEGDLKGLQDQLSEAQKTAASEENTFNSNDSAYEQAIAALKKAAAKALANAQSANATAEKNVTAAQDRLTSAQSVASYTTQILSDAQSASTDLQNAENAQDPADAISSLQDAQTKVSSAVSASNSAISEMPSAGFGQASIGSAQDDLNTAKAVQTDLTNSINDARAWQTAKEAVAAAQQKRIAAMQTLESYAPRGLQEAKSAANTMKTFAHYSNAQDVLSIEQIANSILSDAQDAYSKVEDAQSATDLSTVISDLQAAQTKASSAVSSGESAVQDMQAVNKANSKDPVYSSSTLDGAIFDLNVAKKALNYVTAALEANEAYQEAEQELASAQAAYSSSIASLKEAASGAMANAQSANSTAESNVTSAQKELASAKVVASYTSQILSNSQSASADLENAYNAPAPKDAVPSLQSALKEVEQAINTSNSAIGQMANAGFSTASQADARIDLDSAQITKIDIENALDKIPALQEESEARSKTQDLINQLEGEIESVKEICAAYKQMGSQLQMVSEVLAEPFAQASTSLSTVHSLDQMAQATSQSSAKPLASTGSSVEGVEIASAILLAAGIAAEAVKKVRQRSAKR